jgi:haloacetate dehalogenase
MFEGFTREQIKTKETTINFVKGGSGDPVLLLHGYPQTHTCWHMVAPQLAEKFTIVCPDLRGSGDSGKPPSDPEHFAYSKRAMAADQVEVMQSLGFDKFAVAGHDRGARVAHRMALDHADKITKLALLDIIPTSTAFAKTDKEIATAAFNWVLLDPAGRLAGKIDRRRTRILFADLLDHWRDPKNALPRKRPPNITDVSMRR